MGTSNFAPTNTSVLYVVKGSGDLAQTREAVHEKLEELEKQVFDYFYYRSDTLSVKDDKNYSAKSIGRISNTVDIDGLEEELDIFVTIKSVVGYYYGFVLDYEIQLEYRGFMCDTSDELTSELIKDPEDYFPSTLGKLLKDKYSYDTELADNITEKFVDSIDTRSIENKIDKEIDTFTDSIEKVFSEFTVQAVASSPFSNGEAIYTQVSE